MKSSFRFIYKGKTYSFSNLVVDPVWDIQLLLDAITRGEVPSEPGGDYAYQEYETMYTVPLHVGQNIEVPKGSRVTFYDPKERV